MLCRLLGMGLRLGLGLVLAYRLGFGFTWVRFRLAVRSNASVQVIRTFRLSDVTNAVFRRTQL